MKLKLLFLFSVTVGGFTYAQISNGLVAKMPFTYGSVYDEVGNNQGYNVGAVTTADRFGVANMAYEFNGNDYIYFYHTAATDLDLLNEISISVWIRPDDFSGGMRSILTKWNDATNEQYGLFQNGLNGVYAVRTVNNSGISTSIPVGPSNWYHIVFTFDKLTTTQNLYINGTLVSTSTPTGTVSATTSSTYLSVGAQFNDVNGVPGTPNRFFVGAIDDIQIFDRVVDLSEVQLLYLADQPVCDGFEVEVLQTIHTTSNTGSFTFNVNGGHAPYEYVFNGASSVSMNSSKACGTAFEGGLLTFTAPGTATFRSVNFASYGTPAGACPSFVYTNCHLIQSFTAAEDSLIGNSTGTYLGTNSTFGADPCFGTSKSTAIMASYAEDVTISNLNPGSYALEVTDSMGCQTSITVVINDLALSVNENNQLNFAIYPNPATSNLTLISEIAGQFIIFNMTGEKIQTIITVSTQTNVDISNLNAGIYFIQGPTGETIKLIKL